MAGICRAYEVPLTDIQKPSRIEAFGLYFIIEKIIIFMKGIVHIQKFNRGAAGGASEWVISKENASPFPPAVKEKENVVVESDRIAIILVDV